MDPREMALFSSVFHLPAGITITSVHPSATELVIRIACQSASMPWTTVPPALCSHPWELSTNRRRSALRRPQRDPGPHRTEIRL